MYLTDFTRWIIVYGRYILCTRRSSPTESSKKSSRQSSSSTSYDTIPYPLYERYALTVVMYVLLMSVRLSDNFKFPVLLLSLEHGPADIFFGDIGQTFGDIGQTRLGK